MKRLFNTCYLLLFAIPAMVSAQQSDTGLEKLKSLAGEWKGTDPAGNPVTVSYKLVSSENSLMETLKMPDDKTDMVTVYHLDNDKVIMTHYCSMGNQPRMRLTYDSDSPDKFSFDFLDATNLKTKNDPHMNRLVISIMDENHFSQEWFMSGGGSENSVVFQFERIR